MLFKSWENNKLTVSLFWLLETIDQCSVQHKGYVPSTIFGTASVHVRRILLDST